MSDALAQFERDWLDRLNQGAQAVFRYGLTPAGAGLHSFVADQFAESQGYAPIGFNWELLDASAEENAPRSALGEMVKAIAHDISNPSKIWLGEEVASQCVCDLLSAFSERSLTVVSNRYDGLWNPISSACVEWGFVCFDDAHIALLLLSAD